MYILLTSLAGFSYLVLKTYQGFTKNLSIARESGIPYVIIPVYHLSKASLLFYRKWSPWLRKLPVWMVGNVDLSTGQWVWQKQFTLYKEMGTDTIMTVSPWGNCIYTADADAIDQITTRRNDFPKPVFMYRNIDIFGKSLVSSEGQAWRQHRKITSPPFTEKNNHLVWHESLRQGRNMLKGWEIASKSQSPTIMTIAKDATRLSLNVISKAGFGVSLPWPGVVETQNSDEKLKGKPVLDESLANTLHTMPYSEALTEFVSHLLGVVLIPHWLLSIIFISAIYIKAMTDFEPERLPFEYTKTAYRSFVEWSGYMHELFDEKKRNLANGDEQEGLDLMGALVKGAGYTSETLNSNGIPEKGQSPQTGMITDDEIMANAFVFIIAGHETTANSIHFCSLLLAQNIPAQRRLQLELDQIFQGRPSEKWDYDRDLSKLFNGLTGAVLSEQLRLIPPVVNIPKMVAEGPAQPIVLNDGRKVYMPGGTLLQVNANNVHRNPKYWPHGPASDPSNPVHPTSNLDNDLEEFKPERWFVDPSSTSKSSHSRNPSSVTSSPLPSPNPNVVDDPSLNINTNPDTSPYLLRPSKGAYVPFSEGQRSCLGRRFAQVEALAVIALIFSQYSIELAVDEWASDEEVERMDLGQRRVVWEKARDWARQQMGEGMRSRITIRIEKGCVPVRVVRRGEERFDFGE